MEVIWGIEFHVLGAVLVAAEGGKPTEERRRVLECSIIDPGRYKESLSQSLDAYRSREVRGRLSVGRWIWTVFSSDLVSRFGLEDDNLWSDRIPSFRRSSSASIRRTLGRARCRGENGKQLFFAIGGEGVLRL
eukprot:1392740-Amorphochlora_amoeboformis.AAC.1